MRHTGRVIMSSLGGGIGRGAIAVFVNVNAVPSRPQPGDLAVDAHTVSGAAEVNRALSAIALSRAENCDGLGRLLSEGSAATESGGEKNCHYTQVNCPFHILFYPLLRPMCDGCATNCQADDDCFRFLFCSRSADQKPNAAIAPLMTTAGRTSHRSSGSRAGSRQVPHRRAVQIALGWAKSPAIVAGLSMQELFQIVHETDDLLVVNKPAGLVCHPTKGDQYSSLISRVRIYLGESAVPQMVNRLDRETSGILLVAKNSQTALELRQIWETRAVSKRYLAIVHGHVLESSGGIQAALGNDVKSHVAIKHCVRADGAPAQTDFAVLERFVRDEAEFSLLRVEPVTGRKHQIRIHLAHAGHPVVGDKLYGGDEDLYLAFVQYRLTAAQQSRLLLPNQALHAEQVEFVWNRKLRIFQTRPEAPFMEFAGLAEWPLVTDGCLRADAANPAAVHFTSAAPTL